MNTTLGMYQPGTSVIHRIGPGIKLLVLVVFGVASVFLQRSWWATLVVLALVVLLYPVAGFTFRLLWRQVKPMVYLLGFMAIFHVWISGWQRAVGLTGTLLALIAFAALITLTTPTMRLVQAATVAVRPLRVFGVDPDRVGLMLTLGIRAVPLMIGLGYQVREAQVARGLESSFQAFAVPLIVSALREADAIGEALVARGIDDD